MQEKPPADLVRTTLGVLFLGGLILAYAEDFPKVGETIHIPPFSLTVQATKDNRIDMLKLSVDTEEQAD